MVESPSSRLVGVCVCHLECVGQCHRTHPCSAASAAVSEAVSQTAAFLTDTQTSGYK